jgi:hypothetical protein
VATTRGFIERIEVGRGGLVRATLVDATTRTVFTVSDIDGDPERFNERLTKVAVLRDAMNRAEPVEVEHSGDGDDAHEIQRVARLSRDQLRDEGGLSVVTGLVIAVTVESRNEVAGEGEAHDGARARLIGIDGGLQDAWLDLQAPERLVAAEQLRMLRDALASGTVVQLVLRSPRRSRPHGWCRCTSGSAPRTDAPTGAACSPASSRPWAPCCPPGWRRRRDRWPS